MNNNGLVPYLNRILLKNIPIEVYKNLHKNCFSVRQQGKVIGHTDSLCIEKCIFYVSIKGRERVISSKQKNVHATVKGYYIEFGDIDETLHRKIKLDYNPYINSSFVFNSINSDGTPIHEAAYCMFTASGAYAYI
jgi:hypothetical protein